MPRKNRLAQTHKLASLSDHLSKSTNFTTEEVRLLLLIHQKLEELGPLDRTRFREVMSVIFVITDDVMLDLVFHGFDQNSDGFVDDLEWVRGMSTMLRGSLDQLIDYTYNVYDMNGDGSLAREELYHCLKGCIFSGYGIDEDEIEEVERDIVEIAMRKLDTDRDGQITYSDFSAAVKKDPLLLQAVGTCLPTSRAASAFQSLITDRYQMSSALYPKMPRTRHRRKSRSRIRGNSHNLRRESSVSGLNRGDSSMSVAGSAVEKASRVWSVAERERSLSLSIVKSMKPGGNLAMVIGIGQEHKQTKDNKFNNKQPMAPIQKLVTLK